MNTWVSAESQMRQHLNSFFNLHYCNDQTEYSFVHFYVKRNGYRIQTIDNPDIPMTKEQFLQHAEPGSENVYWSRKQLDRRVSLPIRYLGYLRTDKDNVFDFSQTKDYYLSANGFCDSKRRIVSKLSTIHNLVVDIDCHSGMSFSRKDLEFLGDWMHTYFLEVAKDDPCFTSPNTIVNTGRGFQMWWRFEPYSYQKLSYMWKAVTDYYLNTVQNMFINIDDYIQKKYLGLCKVMGFQSNDPVPGFLQRKIEKIKLLKYFQLDAASSKKRSGIFRVPGTYHSKLGHFGSFRIFHTRRLQIVDLFFQLHPITGKEYVPFKQRSEQSHWNGFAQKREDDLIHLVLHRQKQGFTTYGYRDLICLLVCGAYISTGEKEASAIAAVRRMNNVFDEPMDETQLLSFMSSCLHKKYKFSNRYMIQVLGITEEEQLLLDIGQKKQINKIKKIRGKEEKKEKVLSLYKEDPTRTQNDIAKMTGYSQSTVSRILKKAVALDSSHLHVEKEKTTTNKSAAQLSKKQSTAERSEFVRFECDKIVYSKSTNIIYSYNSDWSIPEVAMDPSLLSTCVSFRKLAFDLHSLPPPQEPGSVYVRFSGGSMLFLLLN